MLTLLIMYSCCVIVWGQMFFDGIQFIYEGPSGETVPGSLIGNARANQTVFSPSTIAMLFPDEYITHVRGRKGAWTDSLEIGTNFGRVFSCGGSGGGAFEVKLPSNVEVRSISFSLGDHLVNAVAFVGEPLTLASEGTIVSTAAMTLLLMNVSVYITIVARREKITNLFGSYDLTAKKNAIAAGTCTCISRMPVPTNSLHGGFVLRASISRKYRQPTSAVQIPAHSSE